MTSDETGATGQPSTIEQIVNDLGQLGIRRGDHLALGVAFSRLGPIQGGAEGFVDAVLETLGPEGTLMVNTFTDQFRLSKVRAGRIDHVFDYRSTPGNTGLVPDVVRRRPDALRSRHPVTSVAAIGRLAGYLTENHGPGAPGYDPFSRLAACGGRYLAIGIGRRLVGIRHQAQYLAGLLDVVPKKYGVYYRRDDGGIHLFVNDTPPGCVTTLDGLVDRLSAEGLTCRGDVGRSEALLLPAAESLNRMTELLRLDPTLNLCDDVTCLWCRELERRLDLYDSVEHPKYFQRSRVIRMLVAAVNHFRLGDNWLIRQLDRLVELPGG